MFAPTCKLISFPDICLSLAVKLAILTSVPPERSISFSTVNLIAFPFESVTVIVELAAIFPAAILSTAIP